MNLADFKASYFREKAKLCGADQKDMAIILIAITVAIEPDAIILIHGHEAAIALTFVK